MPPSTIIHLGHIVAVLRRSPASVEHHHRHHVVVLTELSLKSSARSEFKARHRVERVLNSEVSCVRYLIGRIVKTHDYINRVVLTLPLSVYEGTWTHSPLSLLCITMILRMRRIFFEITTFPNISPYVPWPPCLPKGEIPPRLDVPSLCLSLFSTLFCIRSTFFK